MKRQLAINGGSPVRNKPFPSRALFGPDELQAVTEVFEQCQASGKDFGYQGPNEQEYTEEFSRLHGGGFADAVCSGTAACFVALSALGLRRGSKILVPPVTDPGGVSPVLMLGFSPVIMDASPESFNTGPAQFEKAAECNPAAAIVAHIGGIPAQIDAISAIARDREILLVEDCSQAHLALLNGKPVGTFGDIAFFSTMFSKNHASGGCGGIVYSRESSIANLIRALADRGKPFTEPDFDPRDPSSFLFPALNLNQDELSCAMGLSTLRKLNDTILRRIQTVEEMRSALMHTTCVRAIDYPANTRPSPFFLTVKVDTRPLTVSKTEFAAAIRAEGAPVNPNYRYVLSEWPWLVRNCSDPVSTPNAVAFRSESFNILFNERFTSTDVSDIVDCVLKVESVYCRKV